MRKRLPYIILAIPIIIALVLGYAIYNQIQGTNTTPSQEEKQEETSTTPSVSRSPEEAELLQVPGENATDEERQKHLEGVLEIAKSSDTLNVSSCNPDIFALRVKQGETFTIKNDTTQEHTIVLNEDYMYKIPAQGSTEVEVDFGRGPGIYGYGCDRSGSAVGFLVVSE